MPNASSDHLLTWLMESTTAFAQTGLRIAFILLVAYIAIRAIRIGMAHLEDLLIKTQERIEAVPGAAQKRVKTLVGMLQTVCLALVWVIAVIMTLAQVGLDVTPILAGAGIAGLAVGFGAQNLVRDMISGFFMILENQVRVGDVAIVNGTGGLVEAITFRTITLRDLSGVVHIFPNGAITTLSNMTKEWSAYVIDVGVAYKENTDRVIAIMKEVAEDLRRDADFADKILEPIEVFGVDAFADSAVVIKARLKTRPIEQWSVGREYRRRLKHAFDANGIEIPFPHRTLYMGEASRPFAVQTIAAGSPSS